MTACGSSLREEGGSGSGDVTPPVAGSVADGTGADIDVQASTTTLSATWRDFTDAEGPIHHYEAAVGTAAGAVDIVPWINVGTLEAATVGSLTLQDGATYHVAIRAYDQAGNVSPIAVSDGVTIDTGGGNPVPPPGGTARSLSQWGITWTFATDHVVGQFCNGDWWVQGPVDVVDITPRTQVLGGRTIHGSMVNPVPNGVQGYDSSLYEAFAAGRYSSQLNVATGVSAGSPLHLPAGTSLISAVSQTTTPPNGSLSQLNTAAILTVLATPPAPGSFRPPYSGNDKTVRFRESDLDFTRLLLLPAIAGTPDMPAVAGQFARVWLDHTPGWLSRYLHPVANMPDYSRDFTSLIGTAALLANLDFTSAQKRDLVVRLAQLGIDDFGNVLGGCNWPGTGGQCSGRKFPILFAGHLLHDATMAAIGTSHPSVYLGPGNGQNRTTFGEDSQTFVVQQTSPGVYNWGFGNYTSQHVGMPEWGNSHSINPGNDNVAWSGDSYRRCCTANAWIGQCLALRMMGLRTAWNHAPFFDYMDRYVTLEPSGWTRAWEPWQEAMWHAYRVQF